MIKNLKLAGLAALAAIPAFAEVKLNENFSTSGYIAGSYRYTDFDPSDSADKFDIDAAKLLFNASYKPVSATLSFYYAPNAPEDVTVLDAFVTYDTGTGVTITGGKFLSYLGYEAFDIPAMSQISYANGDFLNKLRLSIGEWGGLTDGQHAAAAKSLARAVELEATRNERREAKLAADRLQGHVGTVGERRDFDLTAERVHSFDGQFGTVYITIFRDADNNVIVYKGSIAFERGEQVRGKATIKAHDQRDGVPQTIIARPKFDQF